VRTSSGIPQMRSLHLSECAIVRTVRSRRAQLFRYSSVSPKRQCQFKDDLRRFTTQGIAVRRLIETSVLNAVRPFSRTPPSCRVSPSSRLARSTTQAGSSRNCMSIATAKSTGRLYLKIAKNLGRCPRKWLTLKKLATSRVRPRHQLSAAPESTVSSDYPKKSETETAVQAVAP
jgi:hypothetical protein